MVIGKEFVWAHFGKTGGNSVRNMFKLIPINHVLYADKNSSPRKHRRFSQIERDIGIDYLTGRYKIMNIRRLPTWIISYVNHMNNSFGVPIRKDELINGYVNYKEIYRNPGDINSLPINRVSIDVLLERFMCGKIDYWLRTEHLAEDFISVFSNFFPITIIQSSIIKRIKSNKSKIQIRSEDLYFCEDEISDIYANCPFWASIEIKLYGNLMASLDLND